MEIEIDKTYILNQDIKGKLHRESKSPYLGRKGARVIVVNIYNGLCLVQNSGVIGAPRYHVKIYQLEED